jgi:tryptophan 2,3-dioxygenase
VDEADDPRAQGRRRVRAQDRLDACFKILARVKAIQKQLEQWSVLETLTPSEYEAFRPALSTSSGFQPAQYRALEFLLGVSRGARRRVQLRHGDPRRFSALLASPSLYDEFLRHLARRGLPVPAACVERDWSQPYERNPTRPGVQDDLRRSRAMVDAYEMAEKPTSRSRSSCGVSAT